MLTFTSDDWNVRPDGDGRRPPRTMTPTDDTAMLTHTAAGADYANVTEDLLVTVTDDDSAEILLSKMGLTVTEGVSAGSSYTVALVTRADGRGHRVRLHYGTCWH